MELVVGSTKRQFSLGRDSAALREQIDKQKALHEEAAPDLKQREKLVAMLVTGGAFAPGASEGRVLEVLAQSGSSSPVACWSVHTPSIPAATCWV